MIEKTSFGGYRQYVIRSGELALSVMELGATVTSLQYKGRELALRYSTAEE